MNKYKISICIPAYRRVIYLRRLLDSIAEQTFKDFEVVISDDSPDNSVKELLILYKGRFTIAYYKNNQPLGTPANWNFAISKARGEWIKLMHDDDWFAFANALEIFFEQIVKNNKLIFSNYANVSDNNYKNPENVYFPFLWRKKILKQPLTLLAHNVIGPPSVTMLHHSIKEQYDERMKWRVDMDFYVRVLKTEKEFTHINKVLINVGINEQQVTNYCFENPLVELPEGFLLLEKYGTTPLKNILVYDAWWRLLRNMNITTPTQLNLHVHGEWPIVIVTMVKHLKRTPKWMLKIGVASKIFMVVSFLGNSSPKNKGSL